MSSGLFVPLKTKWKGDPSIPSFMQSKYPIIGEPPVFKLGQKRKSKLVRVHETRDKEGAAGTSAASIWKTSEYGPAPNELTAQTLNPKRSPVPPTGTVNEY